jgi:Rad3-related DNA helicase
MAKAIQAAGRVIRGPEERGLLAFLDGRFLEPSFAQCFPTDWFRQSPHEAVSEGILAEVSRFWNPS